MNDAPAAWFEHILGSWNSISACDQLWRTVRSGQVQTPYQHKTNAGARSLVTRVPATASLLGPKHLTTNVAVPTLSAGDASLHFLPDRLLVRNGKHYSDVSYEVLRATTADKRFIESGAVPRDARQVDQTWQYVNKNGGPDRRFSNNRVLPVMLYSEVSFTSAGGLDWRLQASRTASGAPLARTLAAPPARPNVQD